MSPAPGYWPAVIITATAILTVTPIPMTMTRRPMITPLMITLTREHHRDNNMRAAVVHVMADAAVSVLVIVGLLLARAFGWLWMDPLAGFIGALVIASWSVGLLRDTGAILLDRMPDPGMAEKIRAAIESEGDQVTDLHLWRLGPGHLGAIVSVATSQPREAGALSAATRAISPISRTSPSRSSTLFPSPVEQLLARTGAYSLPANASCCTGVTSRCHSAWGFPAPTCYCELFAITIESEIGFRSIWLGTQLSAIPDRRDHFPGGSAPANQR